MGKEVRITLGVICAMLVFFAADVARSSGVAPALVMMGVAGITLWAAIHFRR